MPQLNIKCPKCHRFAKLVAGKQISENNFRGIAECRKCNIKLFNSLTGIKWDGKTNFQGKVSSTILEQIDNKAFSKYLKNFTPKKKKLKIEERVYEFLKEKKLAYTTKRLAKMIGISNASATRACRKLRKLKKIGKEKIVRGRWGEQQYYIYYQAFQEKNGKNP